MSTEVKRGYMQTDVGVIPMNWSVTRVDEDTLIKTGSKNTQDRVKGGEYPFYVRSQQVESINSYSYDGEAVLTAGDGVGTGKVFHYINGKFDVHQRVYRISDFSTRLNGRYFFYQFSTRFYDRIMSMTAKSSVDSVRMEMIAGMQIPLPPIHEQSAITAALDDIETLISSLDQLITKKRNIQQATMQQLLTGQHRLPGFNGEWEVKRLGDVGELISGGTPKTSNPEYWGGHIKWCTPTDITRSKGKYLSETERSISEAGLAYSGARLLPAGSLLICTRATIGELKIATAPICTNQGFKSLVCYDGISHEFMYYKLLTMKKDMVERAFGSTFLEISKANISAITLSVPPLAEQTAIATILSDMDTELAALEDRRDKSHQLKQGMMQELLTGRVRLA